MNKTLNTVGLVGGIIAIGLLGFIASKLGQEPKNIYVQQPAQEPILESLGSVSRASEYHATTTNWLTTQTVLNLTTSSIFNDKVNGVLGSVFVGGSVQNDGTLTFYDATTTNQNLRAASMTSSSIVLGSIGLRVTSTAPIVFDEIYYNGLVAVFSLTVSPSTTITYR